MLRRRRRVQNPNAVSPWPFVGMALIAADFFLYGASALVAPWWGVTLLMLVWLALFVVCCRWWTPYPGRLVWVAAGGAVLWFVALVLGGVLLGWSP